MSAGMDVLERNGRMLIRAGVTVQESHIRLAERVGYRSLYVNLPISRAEAPPGIIQPEVQTEAVKIVKALYAEVSEKNDVDGFPIRDLASRLVNEVILNRSRLFHWIDLRLPEDYLPAHAVNVAILSILIGLDMDYTVAKLYELAIGALMLDIGEMLVAPEILHKMEKLTPVEMEIVRQHTEIGFDVLRKKVQGIPAPAAHIAYQHHENFNGQGYPRGIGGVNIHEYARIVSVADMFDALISDRPFRHYYLTHEAVSILQVLAGRFLDPDMVLLLLKHVAIYPKGSIVRLDTCELAEVESVNPKNPGRPRLRLFTDKWGKRLKVEDWINLERQRSRFIDKVPKDDELKAWLTA
jgi:HD-GYP domain-containing protein (c-di-GMP phosphodiesterase class II)